MGFLDKLFPSQSRRFRPADSARPKYHRNAPPPPPGWEPAPPWMWGTPDDAVILKTGDTHDVVGESYYQDALVQLTGGARAGRPVTIALAQLVAEPENPHDRNAVAVHIAGMKVGHLNRYVAPLWQPAIIELARPVYAEARIKGGRITGYGEPTHFGVELRMATAPVDAIPKRGRQNPSRWAPDPAGRAPLRWRETEWVSDGQRVDLDPAGPLQQ